MDEAPQIQRDLTYGIVDSFRPYLKQVVAVGMLILATAGLGVVNPLLIREIFDSGLFPAGGPNLKLIWILVGVMTGITVVTGMIGVLQTVLTIRWDRR